MLHRPNFKYFLQNKTWWSKLSGTYINQRQPFTGFYTRLNKNAYSLVSFLLKLQNCSLKKDSARNIFLRVCLEFQNSSFAKQVWKTHLVSTASAKYHINKMLLSTLAMFWLSSNISITNTVSRLWPAVSGSPRQLVIYCDASKMFLHNQKQSNSRSL